MVAEKSMVRRLVTKQRETQRSTHAETPWNPGSSTASMIHEETQTLTPHKREHFKINDHLQFAKNSDSTFQHQNSGL